jgi:hypothetical protein
METCEAGGAAALLADPFKSVHVVAARKLAETKTSPDGLATVGFVSKEDQSSEEDYLVRLCLQLQNFSYARRIQRLYQNLQDLKGGYELNPIREQRHKPKLRLSPSRRKMDIKDVTADYKAGGSLRELAAKYGVDRKTVALQLRKVGVTLRLRGCNVQSGAISANRSLCLLLTD